jgi:hypothetical protein
MSTIQTNSIEKSFAKLNFPEEIFLLNDKLSVLNELLYRS